MRYKFSSKNEHVIVWIDTYEWTFPLAFHCSIADHLLRPWMFRIAFLCFDLVFYFDEDTE